MAILIFNNRVKTIRFSKNTEKKKTRAKIESYLACTINNYAVATLADVIKYLDDF